VSPGEIVVLSLVKSGINSKDLFLAEGVDLKELSNIIEGLNSSGYLEEFQDINLNGADFSDQYRLTNDGEQKLVGVLNQLSDTWSQIVTAAGNDSNNPSNIAAFVKLVNDNEQWIYVMVILGLITQEAAQEIFNAVNRLVGKDDQRSISGDRLHSLVKDSVENYLGSFIQYD
jgi:hypothetical protein